MRTVAEMAHSGIVSMFEDNKTDDLARAYQLFRRIKAPVNGLSIIREIMAAHVMARGQEIVRDEERCSEPCVYVQGLLTLRDKYDAIIQRAFASDKQCYNTLNESFEKFVNLNQRSPEYVSLFVDEQMRKGMKGTSEEEVDTILDKVVMLFRYLQEKASAHKLSRFSPNLAQLSTRGTTVHSKCSHALPPFSPSGTRFSFPHVAHCYFSSTYFSST